MNDTNALKIFKRNIRIDLGGFLYHIYNTHMTLWGCKSPIRILVKP